jgi:hypothetical protein
MIKYGTVIFLCLAVLNGSAQNTIIGKVVSGSDGIPVPGASVFITNTSKGTTSDSQGRFELTNVPAGKHEIIFSSVGYETNVYPFTDAELPLQLRVEMKLKIKELQNVTVEPYLEEGWDKWGKTFMENFIGYTENAAKCRIKNEKDIRFRYYKKSRRLVAYSDNPIRIENKALGYTISYQLEEFEINFEKGSTLYFGYSLFEDEKNRKSNRKEAFEGSLLHFLRSLYTDSLKENGFEVRRMTKTRNAEKDRVRTVRPKYGSTDTVPVDSIAYYRRIMKEDDFIYTYAHNFLTADSLFIKQENAYKLLYFPNYLFITFKNEPEQKAYADKEQRRPSHQRSFLFLHEDNPVWIERNGNFFDPKDMYSMGYWAWADKMADNLPLDYFPEK